MEQSLKNILVPTDFSQTANNALKAAIDICKKQRSVLHLRHVVETRYITSISPGFPANNAPAVSPEKEKVEMAY